MNSGRLQSALDFIVVPWGIWTLYVQVLVYMRRDFNDLISFAPLPLAVGLAFAAWLHVRNTRADVGPNVTTLPTEPHAYAPWATLAGFSVVWALGWGIIASLLLFGITLAGFQLSRRRRPAGPEFASATAAYPWSRHWRRFDTVLAMLALALALSQVLFIVRTSDDDGFYVGSAVAAIDYPDFPLLRYDFFYGEMDPPVQYLVVHRPQTHELTVAALSRLSGLSVLSIYFLGAPLLAASLWAAVNYLLARRFLPPYPGTILLGIVLLLAAWGESNRVFGNFGFLRIYQGKIVLLCVVVPWIWLSAWRFAERPDLRRAVTLGLVQVVGVGLSSIGAVIGPLAAGLAVGAAWLGGRCTWRSVGAAALLALPAMWTLVMLLLERGQQDMTGIAWRGSVLGEGVRPAVAMGVIGAFPLLFAGSKSRTIPLYCGLGLILAAFLSPLTGSLLGLAANNVSWRYVWAVPVPMLVVVGLIQLARAPLPQNWAPSIAGALVVAFVVGGTWSISRSNRLSYRFAIAKVQPTLLRTAQEIAALAPASEIVLMPNRYSKVLPFVHHHPVQLVGRRQDFNSKYGPTLSDTEFEIRVALRDYVVDRRADLKPEKFVEEVVRRGIHTVAMKPGHRDVEILTELFLREGYYFHQVRRLTVFSRSRVSGK